jgi:bleomycin hydrolase
MQKLLAFLFSLVAITCFGQEPEAYQFKTIQEANCTPVRDQKNSGMCWAYSGASLMESELMRLGRSATDVSEIYIVRCIYRDKAMNYIRRQGKTNFSQGGLAHDAFNAARKYGLMPQDAYPGKQGYAYDHSKIEVEIKALCDSLLASGKSGRLATDWVQVIDTRLDAHFGLIPGTFTYEGTPHNTETYRNLLGVRPEDYVTLTSFTHHPMYTGFVLEIPDNWSNGIHYNVPLNDLMRALNFALQSGYSATWDADVSNKGFAAKHGVAIVPAIDWDKKNDAQKNHSFKYWEPQKIVTPEMRQELFDVQETQDDHLMHIVGLANEESHKDIYYKVKNSWGEISELKGFLFASEAYMRLNTIGITLNKNAIPQDLRRRLGLEPGVVNIESDKPAPQKRKPVVTKPEGANQLEKQ